MGVGKWIKRAIGGVEIVAGAVTGNPALVAKGVGTEVGTLGSDKGGGSKSGGGSPAAVPAAVHTAPLAPGPPMSASSLDVARGQDKSRMKRQYGL